MKTTTTDGPESAVDRAVTELARHYSAGHSPEHTAKWMLAEHTEEAMEEALEYAERFSETVLGADDTAYLAAVLAALREEEG